MSDRRPCLPPARELMRFLARPSWKLSAKVLTAEPLKGEEGRLQFCELWAASDREQPCASPPEILLSQGSE